MQAGFVSDQPGEISRLLLRFKTGDRTAEEELIPLVYDELRRLARCHLRKERPNHTLQATDLVNEALVRLLGSEPLDYHDRIHFYSVASKQIRHILVDYARKRRAAKRDFGRPALSLSPNVAISLGQTDEIVALDIALKKLELRDARQARIVELRFFVGLSNEEAADVLQVCSRTVRREWNSARAWLFRELEHGSSTPAHIVAQRP